MTSKELIYYESLEYKIKFKYTSLMKDDFEINDLKDIQRSINYCYGSTQYIMNFIETMKDKVIKKLPKLNKVKIILCVFDKNNMWHRLMITSINAIHKILNINKKINFYKSIFVLIEYENKPVFMGSLNFENIN